MCNTYVACLYDVMIVYIIVSSGSFYIIYVYETVVCSEMYGILIFKYFHSYLQCVNCESINYCEHHGFGPGFICRYLITN